MTHGTARLLLSLTIDGKEMQYSLHNLNPDRRVAHPAWRMVKMIPVDETLPEQSAYYEVHVDRHGAHCTCADFTYRHQNTPEACKHVRALQAVGLIPQEVSHAQ